MKALRVLGAMAAALALCGAGTLRAQPEPAQPGGAGQATTGPEFSPEAKALLQQTMAAYGQLKNLHVHAVDQTSLTPNTNAGRVNTREYDLKFQAPDKLYLTIVRTNGNRTINDVVVSDGANLWRYNSQRNQYTKGKAPESLLTLRELARILPAREMLGTPARNAPATKFTVGTQTRWAGVQCDTLHAEVPAVGNRPARTMDWYVATKDHLIRGAHITGTERSRDGTDRQIDEKITASIVDPNVTYAASDFAYTPPADATEGQEPARGAAGGAGTGTGTR